MSYSSDAKESQDKSVRDRILLIYIVKEKRKFLPMRNTLVVNCHILINIECAERFILPLVQIMEFNKISSDCAEQMMNKIQCEYSNIESIIPKLSDLTLSWKGIGENVCSGISNSRIHDEILNIPNRVADKKNVYDGRYSVFGVGIATSSEGEVYICRIYKGYGCSTSRY